MKRFLHLLVFVGFLLFGFLHAQNSPDFLKTVPVIDAKTPDWAVLMYSANPNIGEVEKLYREYYAKNPFVKTVHTQNYKHWRKKIEGYVTQEGFIVIPSQAETDAKNDFLKEQFDKRNNETKRIAGTHLNWVNIGPYETYAQSSTNKISWHKNIYCMDQSVSNPNLVICGTEAGGIYKSTDKGANWTLASHNAPFASGNTAIKIHPNNTNTFFLASNNRIYRTLDAGSNWSEVCFTNGEGNEFMFHPTNDDTIFHTNSKGLFRSYNGGTTWTQVFTAACWDIDFHPTLPNTIYLLKTNTTAKKSELFRSDDAGLTWNLKDAGWYVPTDLANASDGGGKIGITAASPNMVYVCLIGASKVNDSGWIGVYRSINQGDTWTNPSGQTGGPYSAINGTAMWNVAAYADGYHQGYYNFDFEVSPTNPAKMWIASIRLTESADSGKTFVSIGGPNSARLNNIHADVQDIEINGTDIWVASDGGINYSNDNLMTHITRNTGINASDFWGFNTGWNEDTYTGGRYHDGTIGWYEGYGLGNVHNIGGVEEASGYVHPIESRKMLFRPDYNSNNTSVKTIPTTVGGAIVSSASLPLRPNENYTQSQSSGVYFDPRYADHLYIGLDNKIWKSTNGGISFNLLYTFPTGYVYEIQISRSNPNVMYCVFHANGGYWDNCEIWKSTNGGTAWAKMTNLPSNRWRMEISINPNDENELWVCLPGGGNNDKVYCTLNGGTTWQNMSSAALNGQKMKDVLYKFGGKDKVYLATDNTVFYWNTTTSTWVDYGTGLPFIINTLRINPFYRDAELRLGSGGRGVWARKMGDTTSLPLAQPITYKDSIFCSRDTVVFDCYSMLRHEGATWAWSFSPTPAYVSSTSARSPKVVFGATGSYAVTLTVTDNLGHSNSKTINNMVRVESKCDVDILAGKSLKTTANGDYFAKSGANLTNVTRFTTTAWIKPIGTQSAFAGIVSNGEWCAHCTTNGSDQPVGFVFDYSSTKLWFRWPGTTTSWAGNSGLTVPLNQWSYVALVVTPDSVMIYLNEQKYKTVSPTLPANIANLYAGLGHYSAYFKGEMDEVTMWNRALSQSEIRALRHLTKEQSIPSDPNLIAYWQFNEKVQGSMVMDKAGKYHGNLAGGATLATSTAPIGSGTSQRIYVGAGGVIDFPTAYAKTDFSECTLPTGEMVISRIKNEPYLPPNTNANSGCYWVINYYNNTSTPTTFAFMDSLVLGAYNSGFVSSLASPSDAYLHLRGQNADDMSWQTRGKAKNLSGNQLGFGKSNFVEGATQLFITNGGTAFSEVDAIDYCKPDTISGKALSCPATSTSDYVQTPNVNLTAIDNFTISAWVKPSGIQADYTGIVMSDGTACGFNFTRGNNTLGYHWNGSGVWSWNSGLVVPANKWSHVVLVITPTAARVYVNGVEATNTLTHTAANLTTFKIGNYQTNSGRNFNGEIDEVCMWSRALTKAEIQNMRHLTKDKMVETDPTLQMYLQFNEASGTAYDKSGKRNHSTFVSTATRIPSTAPVASGVSQRIAVNAAGTYNFNDVGVQMTFPSGTLPNGELVINRMYSAPDSLPNSNSSLPYHWVINNYGTNQTFTALSELKFNSQNTAVLISDPSKVRLFKRGDNEHLKNWTELCAANQVVTGENGAFIFGSSCNLTSFSQFQLMADAPNAPLLPIELARFQVNNLENKKAKLVWTTTMEKNASHFEVEYSLNGMDFSKIGEVAAIGNSSNSTNYEYLHEAPIKGYNYYRLKMIDLDGKFDYSRTDAIFLMPSAETPLWVFPNPTDESQELNFRFIENQKGRIYIFNAEGKLVKDLILDGNSASVDMKGFVAGFYMYSVQTDRQILNGKVELR